MLMSIRFEKLDTLCCGMRRREKLLAYSSSNYTPLPTRAIGRAVDPILDVRYSRYRRTVSHRSVSTHNPCFPARGGALHAGLVPLDERFGLTPKVLGQHAQSFHFNLFKSKHRYLFHFGKRCPFVNSAICLLEIGLKIISIQHIDTSAVKGLKSNSKELWTLLNTLHFTHRRIFCAERAAKDHNFSFVGQLGVSARWG